MERLTNQQAKKAAIREAYQAGSEFALDATKRQAEAYYNQTYNQK